MNVLGILVTISIIVANFGVLCLNSTNAPNTTLSNECYKNRNGFCRTFNTRNDAIIANRNLKPARAWMPAVSEDCSLREINQVKVCYTKCEKFKNADCSNLSKGREICGVIKDMQRCKLFLNLCALKKASCNDPELKDWRVGELSVCDGLNINQIAEGCRMNQ